ncbi:MAG: YfiR family protein [Myxococcales bacterium]|nr:YfiR family protein [Myxococcales bacterium]
MPRRALLRGLGLIALGAVSPSVVLAQDVTVPIRLQVKLLAKVAAYDRNMEERAGGKVRVLVLQASSDAESQRTAQRIVAALEREPKIAGLGHTQTRRDYDGARELVKAVKEESFDIVYVTPGLEDAVDEIRGALIGIDVLSVSAVASHVPDGIVLGFDLSGGKPKLQVNLTQAKQQNVAFKSSLLRLAKVYR